MLAAAAAENSADRIGDPADGIDRPLFTVDLETTGYSHQRGRRAWMTRPTIAD